MNLKVTNKAIFLDRDGVINVDKQYVSQIEEFEFTEGIFDLLLTLQDLGYLLIVITNQSGIGRGYYTLDDFEKLTAWKLSELEKRGIFIQKVYYCPHSPESHCDCRKPSPKMLLEARENFQIDMKQSWMVGDKKSDIEAGKNAGVGKTVFVNSKKGEMCHTADFTICRIAELEVLVKKYS